MSSSIRKFVTGSVVAGAMALSLALPSAANAQGRAARVGAHRLQNMQRQERQQIRQGLKNGSLTKAQATKLAQGEKNVLAQEHAAKANGGMTPANMAQLKAETKAEAHAMDKAEDLNKSKSAPPPATIPPTTSPSTATHP